MNSEPTNILTNICHDFIFNWQTEKKNPAVDQLLFSFISQLLKLRKFRGNKMVKHLMNSLNIYFFPCKEVKLCRPVMSKQSNICYFETTKEINELNISLPLTFIDMNYKCDMYLSAIF